MNPLKVELYTEIHQRQLNNLLSREQDKITSFRNRIFLADAIRETGVTESIKKRFNANGELSNCLRYAGLESYGNTLTRDQIADVIIGNEVIHNFGEFLHSFCDGLGKIYQSGWRWIQSLIDNSDNTLKKIDELMDAVKNSSSTTRIKCNDLDGVIKSYSKIDTTSIRENACKQLTELKKFDSTTFYQLGSESQTMRKIIRELKKSQSAIVAVEEDIYYMPKKEISVADAYKQAKQLQPIISKSLKNVIDVNNKYQGFWKTGFAAGKLDAIISAIPGGFLASAMLLNEARAIAVNSWDAISESCSLDSDVAKALIDNLEAIASVK